MEKKINFIVINADLIKMARGGEVELDINIAFFSELSEKDKNTVMHYLSETMELIATATQGYYQKKIQELEEEEE